VIRDIAVEIVVAITAIMVMIAVLDLLWSRFNWRQDLRMTKQEVKDEMKQAEGDPIMRSRLRSLQRDRARRRMMAEVPKATLVIANPTHYAIALRYVREETAAPVVIAKGQDLVALKIREIAEANEIPVFEDVALARSMYSQVSVDNMIPPQFYQAVAELVRVLYTSKAGPAVGKVTP
jgi:flagellar biosynthetic protein FlhB